MIERYVFFRFKPEFQAEREEAAETVRQVLSEIPGLAGFAVGTPGDADAERSWDLSLAVRCMSLAEVQSYIDHPLHRRLVDGYLAPRTAVKKAWNFQISST